MQTSLQGIASKARRDRKYRFNNLYGMVNEKLLLESWSYINRKAAAGIDGVTAERYQRDLERNISELAQRLKEKRYRARFVKRVYIPKGNGKTRPLGIPVVEDRLVQMTVARILTSIYEQDFLPCSYGYRPKVGAREAVHDIREKLQHGKFAYVVDADIKGFFDNIDHEWMIRMLEERIDDKAFLRLIKKWLKAGILNREEGVEHPEKGSPQGGVVSPILANIYLHYALDLWFEKVVKAHCEGEAYLCRYADDFIVAFRYARDAEKFYRSLVNRLKKFKLEISQDKTRLIRFSRFRKETGSCFEFLGFEFRWGVSRNGKDVVKRRTSRKKFRTSLRNLSEWCKTSRSVRLRKFFRILNAKLRGYYNYYGVIGNYQSLAEFYHLARRILYKWLNRRSQKSSFNYEIFARILDYYKIEKPRITEISAN